MRAAPAPAGLVSLVRAHARCPWRRLGVRSARARLRGAPSALHPSRSGRASYSGDEEPFAHPAQTAAAAGRLHCLTITRAGFSPSATQEDNISLTQDRYHTQVCLLTRKIKTSAAASVACAYPTASGHSQQGHYLLAMLVLESVQL
ncbi:hypothetical protein MC885_009649, partial [Smutsia gigantea]